MAALDAAWDAKCPERMLLDQVSDKWSMLVLMALEIKPMRFNALKRQLTGVSQKTLTQCLRRLERNGLLRRQVLPTSPIAVEYRLSPLAVTLLPPCHALSAWAAEHLAQVEVARRRFDDGGEPSGDALMAAPAPAA